MSIAPVGPPVDTSVAADAPLLEMRGIVKSFPGVKAVRDGRLTLRRGQVVALLGENGAGKSTLMKILGGAYRADAGEILIDGKPVEIRTPIDAQRLGVAMIYQELDLIPTLTVRENLFLGREHAPFGLVRKSNEHRRALALFARLNIPMDPEAVVRTLTVAQQQVVAIAKAIADDARVVVMDEPSAPLTPREVEGLFTIIRDLTAHGIGVIYISHRLDEIFTIANSVVVMRDGMHVASEPIAAMTRHRLIEHMVGRTLEQEFPRDDTPGRIGGERLVVRNLSRGSAVRDVSFSLRRGEIVGLTGLVGAGRTEVARLLFGADHRDTGTITLDGRELSIRSPRDAIHAGICLLSEDRKQQGLVLGASVQHNFGLPNLDRLSRLGLLAEGQERRAFAKFVGDLRIKIANQSVLARTLSGGNQQKVVLAKWLERDTDVIIFDEPTRGIDVGAKYEIYLLINALAREGKAILMISSELPEVLGMSDRVLVMREGRLTGEFADVRGLTQEQVMAAAVR